MKYNPEIHCRQSIRLQGYDYSNQCAYFVTICTWSREYILGDVLNSVMQLTSFGEIAMIGRAGLKPAPTIISIIISISRH